ncbi:MAG: long-chain fatty acid--CoA ligase [Proteobacteria bacterium]|nr:long-chain fatty acid--CoA ligase [Pseudomonadota bacterium]
MTLTDTRDHPADTTAQRWSNLPAMLFECPNERAERPFLWAKRDGGWVALTWREVAELVSRVAAGLSAAGVKPGDRVVLVSESRPEWLIADFAIMTAGAVTVPTYVTNTARDHAHILNNSGAVCVIVSTAKLLKGVLEAAAQAPALRHVITIDADADAPASPRLAFHRWQALARTAPDPTLIARAMKQGADELACIIYTSGTGGAPKGVMLHHGAMLHNCRGATDALAEIGLGDEVFLSFLPLSHSYEHTGGQFFPVSIGAEIYYAEGVEHLARNLVEVRPTLMTAVPRLYETMRGRILRSVEAQGGLARKMFFKTLELGRRKAMGVFPLGPVERVLDRVLDRVVRDKVRARFGGRLKALVSGGAPLNPDVGYFFAALGLCLLQGYGQTESAPVITVNRPRRIKMHTVGPVLKDVELRLADDGEILVRGELVMKGYWQDPDATAAAILDGWLHTGDIGRLDDDGYLEITDRKKDIIVNSGGDNVAPQRVEGLLTLEPGIMQAMVYGDRRPHLVAVLVPEAEWLAEWVASNGRQADLAQLATDRQLIAELAAIVDRVNANLSPIEKVRRFIVAREPFTVANQQMTPTLKVRRHAVRAAYGADLDALYG